MKAQYCFSCMNELAGQVAKCPYCHALLPYQIENPNDLPAGMVLKNRYLIGRSLGRGGFGATYISRDLKRNKVLTIKEYFPEFACERRPGSNYVAIRSGREEKFESCQKEFKAEAQHLRLLRDIPGVVQYYDYFEAFGTSYLVMSYLEGDTLKNVQEAQHHPFSLQEAVDYTLRMLQVLARVHAKGVLHRDISPDNIFLTNSGQVFLIDFGSSGLATQTTMTGTSKGVFTAPEQRISGVQGKSTDLYAVGVTLFTLLVNRKPKESEGIQLEEMPDVFPPAIREVYSKVTQNDASQRYRSAEEMALALSQAAGIPMPAQMINRTKKLKTLLTAMMTLAVVMVFAIVMAVSSSDHPSKDMKMPATELATAMALPTYTATEVPIEATTVTSLQAASWLCRRDGKLYCISDSGMMEINDGSFPVEEKQLRPVELQMLESFQQIYDLNEFEIIHWETDQSFALTDVTDFVVLWLLPGEYALRISKGDQQLEEPFVVPGQGPVSPSGQSERIMAAWWNGEDDADVSMTTQVPVMHEHQWQEDQVKAATCSDTGELVQLCTVCGKRETIQQPALGHNWSDADCTSPSTCKVCGKTSGKALGHAWGEWQEKEAATCIAGGTEERFCGNCGKRESKDTSALDHDWGEWQEKKAATCTTGGTEERFCGNCGKRESKNTSANKLGHSWSDADCTSPGTCKICGKTSGKALGHAWGEWQEKKAATCTTGGTEERFCGNCGKRESKNTSALDHAWGDWQEKKAATCTTGGTEERFCGNCGKRESKNTSALGHAWGDWHEKKAATCITGGTEERFCGNCGKRESKNTYASEMRHRWSEANCTSPSTCEVCGKTSGKAIEHAWGDWHEKKAATCTAFGTEERFCGYCGKCETRSTGPQSHMYGDWHVISPATCSAPEISRRICGNCGYQAWKYGSETEAHVYVNGSCQWCGVKKP